MHPVPRSCRRRATGLLAVVLAVSAAIVAPSSPAAALPEGVYSVPHSPQLYYHLHSTTRGDVLSPVDFASWRAQGFPAPVPAPTQFLRHPWSPTVHAVTTFGTRTVREPITLADWQRAGSPAPRETFPIPDTLYFGLRSGGPEIMAMLDWEGSVLTPEQWASAGYPAPGLLDVTYLRLAWEPTIVELYGTQARVVTYERWIAMGAFPPYRLPMLPGDYVCRIGGGATLSYVGRSFEGTLTFEQWVAAGQPQPTRTC